MHIYLKEEPSRRKEQPVLGFKHESWGRAKRPVCLELSNLKGEREKEVWEVAQSELKGSGWVFLNSLPGCMTFTSALWTLLAKKQSRELDKQASIIRITIFFLKKKKKGRRIQTTWIFHNIGHYFEENWFIYVFNGTSVELILWRSCCLDMWYNSGLKRTAKSPYSQEGIWYYKLLKAILYV